MQLRWTEEAADDLERIADYLLAHTPDRAPDLVRSVYHAPSVLLTFPSRGRPGKKEGASWCFRSCRTSWSTRSSAMSCSLFEYFTVLRGGHSGLVLGGRRLRAQSRRSNKPPPCTTPFSDNTMQISRLG